MWFQKGLFVLFYDRFTILHHTAYSSSYHTLTWVCKHVNPCNAPQLRCLCWPWQNCHHIPPTHVGLQNAVLSLFHCLEINTDLVDEDHKKYRYFFPSLFVAMWTSWQEGWLAYLVETKPRSFCSSSINSGIYWLQIADCSLCRCVLLPWHSHNENHVSAVWLLTLKWTLHFCVQAKGPNNCFINCYQMLCSAMPLTHSTRPHWDELDELCDLRFHLLEPSGLELQFIDCTETVYKMFQMVKRILHSFSEPQGTSSDVVLDRSFDQNTQKSSLLFMKSSKC